MFEYYNSIDGTWQTNPRFQEILRLDKMLNEANIPHVLTRVMDGWQVAYPVARNETNCVMDAVEHNGSYGRGEDKLEIMGLLTPEEEEYDEVLGYLTAEEVFERIRKHYNGEWDAYINSLETESTKDVPSETPSNNIPMTPEEFAQRMKDTYEHFWVEKEDEELVHGAMDDLMCNLLRQLGYSEGIDIFENTPKWYA